MKLIFLDPKQFQDIDMQDMQDMQDMRDMRDIEMQDIEMHVNNFKHLMTMPLA